MTDRDATRETIETDEASRRGGRARAEPGAVLVFSCGAASLIPVRVPSDGVVLGRGSFGGAVEKDDRASRNHVRITRAGSAYTVEDAGSRNGTRLRSEKLEGAKIANAGDVIRFGRSIVLLVRDVTLFESAQPVIEGDLVLGPTSRAVHAQIALAAKDHDTMLLFGPSGAGKESAANAFHLATGRDGPLVPVNCAAIPAGLAERLLFGARKGAYSGADADSEGYVQSAHNGTLFLDEIAELDLTVQAKLLRALESHEVQPLGASKSRKVDVRFCFATHKDLRAEVASNRFRQDLFFRISRPEAKIPALHERLEEIPWLIAKTLGNGMTAHPSLVESCMMRAWPGNVRELVREVQQAALVARGDQKTEVTAAELSENAGAAIVTTRESVRAISVDPKERAAEDERIGRALAEANGNVTRAAKVLGLHRTQLRRWMDKQAGPK